MPIRSAPPLLVTTTIAAHSGAIQRLLRASIPALADFAVTFLLTGSTIVCVAGAHATAEGTRLVRQLRRLYRVRRSDPDSTVARVIREARPQLRTDIQADAATRAADDPIAALHHRLAPRSAVAVPIVAGKQVLGALSLCYSHSGRSHAPEDIAAASHLAARIARRLTRTQAADATLGLRAPTGHARQGTTLRRRVAARN